MYINYMNNAMYNAVMCHLVSHVLYVLAVYLLAGNPS